jgi:hypothetical protein
MVSPGWNEVSRMARASCNATPLCGSVNDMLRRKSSRAMVNCDAAGGVEGRSRP